MSTCHASVLRSLAPRPLIASTTRIAGVLATIVADGLYVVDDAGGRLTVLHEHGLDGRVGGERLLDVGRHGLGAPRVVEGGHLGAPVGVEFLPALAEIADGRDEHVVARVHDVGDGGFHGAGPAGGVHHDVVLRLVDVLHPRDDLLEDLGEPRCTVVDDRLGEGGEHLGRHGSRARSDEEALLHRWSFLVTAAPTSWWIAGEDEAERRQSTGRREASQGRSMDGEARQEAHRPQAEGSFVVRCGSRLERAGQLHCPARSSRHDGRCLDSRMAGTLPDRSDGVHPVVTGFTARAGEWPHGVAAATARPNARRAGRSAAPGRRPGPASAAGRA